MHSYIISKEGRRLFQFPSSFFVFSNVLLPYKRNVILYADVAENLSLLFQEKGFSLFKVLSTVLGKQLLSLFYLRMLFVKRATWMVVVTL